MTTNLSTRISVEAVNAALHRSTALGVDVQDEARSEATIGNAKPSLVRAGHLAECAGAVVSEPAGQLFRCEIGVPSVVSSYIIRCVRSLSGHAGM